MEALPRNNEAEREVLGAILNNNDCICDVIDILKPEDFYNSAHEFIYKTILDMYGNNIPADLVTLVNQIGPEKIKAVGGISYISGLMASSINSNNANKYAEIIKEKADRRRVIRSCTEALQEARDEEKNIKGVIGGLEDKLLNIGVNRSEKILTDEELMEKTLNMIQTNYEAGGEIPGISTGFKNLDKATGGLRKGDLIIIAGRPSMGKTMFSLNVSDNIVKENKAAIFELEMSAEKLGSRRLASRALINATKLPRGDMSSDEWVRLTKRAGEIATRNNMFTDTTPGITMAEIRAKCKKIKLKYGLDVVVIDHLGLITPTTKESRVQQVSEITRQGKILAKDLDVAVIMLSQLSRACEARNDKRPMLSDLRESGSIEQDADLVMFMYRDEYYNKEGEKKGILECILAKQRDGRTGTLEFSYMAEYQRITEKPF